MTYTLKYIEHRKYLLYPCLLLYFCYVYAYLHCNHINLDESPGKSGNRMPDTCIAFFVFACENRILFVFSMIFRTGFIWYYTVFDAFLLLLVFQLCSLYFRTNFHEHIRFIAVVIYLDRPNSIKHNNFLISKKLHLQEWFEFVSHT